MEECDGGSALYALVTHMVTGARLTISDIDDVLRESYRDGGEELLQAFKKYVEERAG